MIDPSPRAPLWLRIVRHPVVRLLLLGTLMFYTMGFSNNFQGQLADRPLLAIAAAVGMVVLGLLVYAGFVRWVEGRRVSELALAPAGREFGIGLLGGAALYTACVLILMALGDFRIDGLNPLSFLVPGVAMALSSGFLEELLFRGALFRIVEEWLGSWISIVVSSLVFGLAHLANPAATLEGALFISVEAGLLFAATFMLTRRLWLGIGVHVAWNYTQSAIFSGAVSGNEAAPGLVRDTIQGPAILTGGAFGVELSLVAFLLCTGVGVVLLVLAVRRGHVVQPFWKRQDAAAGAGAAKVR
jgi:membrane protease YdiL (CAAX protease family)